MRPIFPHLAVAALALALTTAARAQTPGPMPVQTYAPPPPGDPFFTVPGTRMPGHLATAFGAALSHAREPLILEQDGDRVPGGQLVREQTWIFAQGALGLGEHGRVDVAVPLIVHQEGDQYYPSVPMVQSSGLGDVRLGGQLWLAEVGRAQLAGGLDVWLPTATKTSYATDGRVRVQQRLFLSGESGRVTWGAQLGVLFAQALDVDYASTGAGLVWGGAVALRLGAFRVGPETWGKLGFGGTGSPAEALLGAHWTPARLPLDVGLAASTAIRRDPGAAPARLVLTVAWSPKGR